LCGFWFRLFFGNLKSEIKGRMTKTEKKIEVEGQIHKGRPQPSDLNEVVTSHCMYMSIVDSKQSHAQYRFN
jgi:hypothetical protein